MRIFTKLIIPLLAILLITNGFAQEKQVDWAKFSDGLIRALKSDNHGLKMSAMQLIIKHAENLTVNAAVYDIYEIYRYHDNDKVRQLALIALYKMDHTWALQKLVEDVYTESNPIIQYQIKTILEEKPILSSLR